MIPDRNVDDWVQEFAARREEYVRFEHKLRQLIEDLLDQKNIDRVALESRTKRVDSLTEKLVRKGYRNPHEEVTDLIGVRIVVYYLEDIKLVKHLIESNFKVNSSSSPSHGDDPLAFGYASHHFVVSIGEARSQLSEWRAMGHVNAEIQVRTALQHAWAAVSHKLEYKSAVEVPVSLKRRLARLSALFELADEQFSHLRWAKQELDQEYENQVRSGRLTIPLDADSLSAYLRESMAVQRLTRIAARHQWVVGNDENESAHAVIRILHAAKVETLAEVDQVLGQPEERLEQVFSHLSRVVRDESSPAVEYPITIGTLIVVMLVIDQVGSYEDAPPELQELLLEAIPYEEWMLIHPALRSLGSKNDHR
jgi:ppGpp synthetase/RelA/SpoT-type nucleotidyltranferase